MLRIWGKVIKDNKIIKDAVVVSEIEGEYQQRLKSCIVDLCRRFDIEKPYWLPSNLNEYNSRNKTIFDKHNFIDEINFDRFVIEELKDEK